jgi:hypothetical protein
LNDPEIDIALGQPHVDIVCQPGGKGLHSDPFQADQESALQVNDAFTIDSNWGRHAREANYASKTMLILAIETISVDGRAGNVMNLVFTQVVVKTVDATVEEVGDL